MSDITKLRVMISSRSLSTVFDGMPLRAVRERLQARLHTVRWQAQSLSSFRTDGAKSVSKRTVEAPLLAGRDQPLFDVWIHENDPGEASDASTFQISLREISRADIVIVLYTGEAGSAAHDRQLGICHAELYEAITRRPEIVSVIALAPFSESRLGRDIEFRHYVDGLSLFRDEIDNEQALHEHVLELLQERIAQLAKRGGRSAERQRDRGQALDWKQLDLAKRRETMRDALRAALSQEPAEPVESAPWASELQPLVLPGGTRLLARLDAIPAALTVAAARELVGQPFLRDHHYSAALSQSSLPGIVHLIACHRGVTEAQALRMLGTPDAVAIASDFGVFVADHVQKTQLVLLAQCSDVTAIALALRRFAEWLSQSREEARVVARAQSRQRILSVLSDEQKVVPKAQGKKAK